jgi:hypothetical protein
VKAYQRPSRRSRGEAGQFGRKLHPSARDTSRLEDECRAVFEPRSPAAPISLYSFRHGFACCICPRKIQFLCPAYTKADYFDSGTVFQQNLERLRRGEASPSMILRASSTLTRKPTSLSISSKACSGSETRGPSGVSGIGLRAEQLLWA